MIDAREQEQVDPPGQSPGISIPGPRQGMGLHRYKVFSKTLSSSWCHPSIREHAAPQHPTATLLSTICRQEI